MCSCNCYCWRLAPKRQSKDIIDDNVCFCGFASVRLQSPNRSLEKADIVHVTFKNDVCIIITSSSSACNSMHCIMWLILCWYCYHMQYFECPYLLCVDHAMQAVVVCVRGTLSFKASICSYMSVVLHSCIIIPQDILTDITVSVKKLEKDDIGIEGPCNYVHGVSIWVAMWNCLRQNLISYFQGMYHTAMKIKEQLLDQTNPILMTTCRNNNVRSLIIG